MSLIKRSPRSEVSFWNPEYSLPTFSSLQKDINRMFSNFLRNDGEEGISSETWYPAVDIAEDGDNYIVKTDLPGLKKEDVKVTLNNNVLTISGEKKHEEEKKGENYYRVERSYGTFERSFTVPGTVKGDTVDAKFTDGVLTVTLPKTEEAKRKVIEVKVK